MGRVNKLLKAEFYKLFHSASYGILLVFSLGMGVLRGLMVIFRVKSVTGYEMFAMELSPDLIHVVLIAVFVVTYVCEEFSDCTFRMSLFCGFPRGAVFPSKIVVFSLGLIPLAALPVAAAAGIVTLGNGFGALRDNGSSVIIDLISRYLCYNLQYLFLGSFGLLAVTVVRDSAWSFGVSLAGMAALIFATGNVWEESEFIRTFILVYAAGTIGLWTVSTFLFIKQDLK